ncbi:hypothetical protein ACOME3_001500 [Neoechinorhynchus agilis]
MTGESADSKSRPVIIHRAILGSVERLIAIITEHFGGRWPFWLSPRQVAVVPITGDFDQYAEKVHRRFRAVGFMSEAKLEASESLNKKIRRAQLEQFNFILVVGAKEQEAGTVNVRTRDNQQLGEMDVDTVISRMRLLVESRCLSSEIQFTKL